MRRVGVALAILALSALGARWDSYVPRTLRSVIEANQARLTAQTTQIFATDSFPTKARVVYDGQLRPIPAARLAFLTEYLGTVKGRPEWARTYTTEILCREGEAKYWLPLQGPLVPRIGKEIAPGDPLDIYATFVGARKNGSDVDWVFTVNEFLSVPAQTK